MLANANNDNDLWRGVGKGRIAVFDELVVLPMHSMHCILTVVALALRSHAYLHMVWLKDPQEQAHESYLSKACQSSIKVPKGYKILVARKR